MRANVVSIKRHQAGSWADDGGVDLRSIQRTLGHASIDTTEKAYLKSRAEMSRATVTAAESMLMQAIQRDRAHPLDTGNSAGTSDAAGQPS